MDKRIKQMQQYHFPRMFMRYLFGVLVMAWCLVAQAAQPFLSEISGAEVRDMKYHANGTLYILAQNTAPSVSFNGVSQNATLLGLSIIKITSTGEVDKIVNLPDIYSGALKAADAVQLELSADKLYVYLNTNSNGSYVASYSLDLVKLNSTNRGTAFNFVANNFSLDNAGNPLLIGTETETTNTYGYNYTRKKGMLYHLKTNGSNQLVDDWSRNHYLKVQKHWSGLDGSALLDVSVPMDAMAVVSDEQGNVFSLHGALQVSHGDPMVGTTPPAIEFARPLTVSQVRTWEQDITNSTRYDYWRDYSWELFIKRPANANCLSTSTGAHYTSCNAAYKPRPELLSGDNGHYNRVDGVIKVTESGNYAFRLYGVDDYARVVVDRDPAKTFETPLSQEKTQSINLDAGYHMVTIEHWDTGGGGKSAGLEIKSPSNVVVYNDLAYAGSNNSVTTNTQKGTWYWPTYLPKQNSAALIDSNGDTWTETTSAPIVNFNTGLRAADVFDSTQIDARNNGRTLIVKRNTTGKVTKGIMFDNEYPIDALYANSKIYVLTKVAVMGVNANNPVLVKGLKLYALDTSLNKIDNAEAVMELQSNAVYTGEGLALESDTQGNVYLMGTLIPDVTADFKNGSVVKVGSVTTGKRTLFVAKLDANLNWQWVKTPSAFTGNLPVNKRFAAGLAVNPNTNDVYIAASFSGGTFTITDEDGNSSSITATDTKGFLSALSPTGKWSAKATVTVASSRANLLIKAHDNSTAKLINPGVGDFKYLIGSSVTVQAPTMYYVDNAGRVLYDAQGNLLQSVNDGDDVRAVTRYRCTGYNLEGEVKTGEVCKYTFNLQSDTSIEFLWETEHLLSLDSHYENPNISDAVPNPILTVGRHWIPEGEQVTLQVDGTVTNKGESGQRELLYDVDVDFLDKNASDLAFPQAGYALKLDGVNDYAQLPKLPGSWLSGNYTVEFWVKPLSYKGYDRIVDLASGSPNTDSFLFDLYEASTKKPRLWMIAKGVNFTVLDLPQPIALNQWTHVAVTVKRNSNNAAQSTAVIYINGTQVATSSTMATLSTDDRTISYLGKTLWSGTLTDAMIDEFRIWNSARSLADIANTKNKTLVGNESGLLLYYDFEQIVGDKVADQAGSKDASLLNMDLEQALVSSANRPDVDLVPQEQRQQPLSFTMQTPLAVTYNWKTQYLFQINASSSQYNDLPLLRVIDRFGEVSYVESSVGQYWVDKGASVQLLIRQNVGTSMFEGWQYGQGLPSGFKEQGSASDLTQTVTINGDTYVMMPISAASNPVSLTWNMKILTLTAQANIGDGLSLSATFAKNKRSAGGLIDDKVIDNLVTKMTNNQRLEIKPNTGFVITGPDASQFEDMVLWSSIDKKVYPLRPGKVSIEWSSNEIAVGDTSASPDNFRVELSISWPAAEHYPFVINTPPVALDISSNDSWAFVKLAYTEIDAKSDVVTNGQFAFNSIDDKDPKTSEVGKRSVLIFTCTDKGLAAGVAADAALGQTQYEAVCVRVVKLKNLKDVQGAPTQAVIGDVLLDAEHNAPHSAYVYNSKAPYNPNIYQPELLQGPIIPVNKQFTTQDTSDDLGVLWYKSHAQAGIYEPVYWPFKAINYTTRWPEKIDPQAGQRVVVASRLGSDGLNADHISPQWRFDSSRVEEVTIYNQPDKSLAGYNPNEEHALIAPSLAYATETPRPVAAYALRNDLNVTAQDATYTSDPYVLVQYFDKQLQAYRMRVYQVQMSDTGTVHRDFSTLEAGLNAAYFAGKDFDTLKLNRIDAKVDNNYGTGTPATNVIPVDGFSIRWQGYLVPDETGEYQITVNSDDGVGFWIGDVTGAPLMRDWTGHGVLPTSGKVTLEKDVAYPIRLEYFEGSGGALVSLTWKKPSASSAVVIAPEYLKHAKLLADQYDFKYPMKAGEPVVAPYPVNLVQGVQLPDLSWGHQGATPTQKVYWEDHKGQGWAISGGASVYTYAWYPMQKEFWWPSNTICYNAATPTDYQGRRGSYSSSNQPANASCVSMAVGTLVPFAQKASNNINWDEIKTTFATTWPEQLPVLRVGETLTFSGGESEEDGASDKGLPGVLAFAAGQIVFDSVNPNFALPVTDAYSARLAQVLEKRAVKWSIDSFNTVFSIANGDLRVFKGNYFFNALPASLQDRVYYDPLVQELVIRGFVNGKTLGDETLTAAPGAIYSLLPNILSADDVITLKAIKSAPDFQSAVDALYAKSRNPNSLSNVAFGVGLERVGTDTIHASSFGTGLALMPSSQLMDPANTLPDTMYVTVAENNRAELGDAPVSLHIVKLQKDNLFRGEIDVLRPANVFDEKTNLRHTADFGANGEDIVFEWWYREEDGLSQPIPNKANAGIWKIFADQSGKGGLGMNQISLSGAAAALLGDNLFFVHYRHKDCIPSQQTPCWSDWAGAANNNPAKSVYQAQLSEGWIKRIVDSVNLFEARINDFYSSESPATYSSMLQQAGQRYNGAVALNADKDVVENVGLIQLYQTVLERAKLLSIDASQPYSSSSVINALQLAATRLAQLYTLLGNEAYVDSLDPTIGFTTQSGVYGSVAPSIFAFKNQMPSLIDEELALLRGRSEFGANPAFNRLMWNFTIGDGEVAYALNYDISDVDESGFIDEVDARTLYPQGHGDAWGHYTMALGYYYDLLSNPNFSWNPRAEMVLVDGVTVDVDFQDEQRFAQIAAARAKSGRDIVNLTYRANYVEDPNGQWQGYKDRQTERAWGVTEWAERVSTGAYFDWAMANAMLPDHDADFVEGIKRIDRSTVPEIQDIASQAQNVYALIAQADSGQNPLGLLPDVVPFDIDPARVDRNSNNPATHFEQVVERAEQALDNAFKVFDYANTQKNRVREVADSSNDLLKQATDQDRDLKNRLIEVFGTPYEGTMGSGKTYPAGYDGPDIYYYQYIDTTDMTNAPAPSNFDTKLTTFFNAQALQYGDFQAPNNTTNNTVSEVSIDLPVSASDYSFVRPPEWGIRRAAGSIQEALSELVRKQEDVKIALADYNGLIGELEGAFKELGAKVELNNGLLNINDTLKNDIKSANDTVLGLRRTAAAMDGILDFTKNLTDMMIESMPKVIGLANDPVGPIRGVMLATKIAQDAVVKPVIFGLETAADVVESNKEITQMESARKIDQANYSYEQKQQLREIQSILDKEAGLRLALFRAREALAQAGQNYRNVLSQGLRLLDERENLNKRIAAKAQGDRYKDMTFRLGQYDALQKYQAAFDLAARYVYMAARVYDYETNLSDTDSASAQSFLTSIVKERLLGQKETSGAVSGQGGLAEILSTLKVNFAVLKTQMGFNNPQTESGRFSLRQGLFRIKTSEDKNQSWQDTLAQHKVENLWSVPEFRRFARNFAPESAGAQPGIVIRFNSTIEFGKNFFGWPLSGGDHAYDASNFATKVRSVGVWFDGYDNAALSETPRVYLIPVGLDVMQVPNSVELDTREWDVVDQLIPVPLPARDSDLSNGNWIPKADGLSGSFSSIRRHSSFRAYHDSGVFNANDMVFDSRLVGRSVWNTQWMLIIPGGTFLADSDEGLNTFIYGKKVPGTEQYDGHGVQDIKLFFQTYAYSGN